MYLRLETLAGDNFHSVRTTGALPAIEPEATAIGIIARWPLENNLNIRWAQVLHTEKLVFNVTADDTSLVISDDLLWRNQSRCDCLGRNGIIISRAVRHIAITTFGNGRWQRLPSCLIGK